METPHSKVFFRPGTCDFTAMTNHSAATFTCTHINGHAVVPVQAAFGGWGMYDARVLRPQSNISGSVSDSAPTCRHNEAIHDCEHVSLSRCLVEKFKAKQVIATGLVVNWEGCSEKQQHRWDGWFPGRGPVE
jgi:hypothetical protein